MNKEKLNAILSKYSTSKIYMPILDDGVVAAFNQPDAVWKIMEAEYDAEDVTRKQAELAQAQERVDNLTVQLAQNVTLKEIIK